MMKMKRETTNNVTETEICFAVTALLVNVSVLILAAGVLWLLVSELTQNLPILIMTNEYR